MSRSHYSCIFTKSFCYLAAIVMLSGLYPSRAASPSVPGTYQDLYTSLQGDLAAFNATLGSSPQFGGLHTGTLTNADGNSGPQLVNAGYSIGLQLQLQALKAMGVQAVMIEVGFPMLYRPFFSSQSQYQQFVTFYQQAAANIRALGMKVIVENNCLLSSDVQAGWNVGPFYSSLSWTQYQQARAQTAAIIAQTMHPDYMVVLEEPDTEAAQAVQPNVNTSSGAAAMLSQILSSVRQSGVSGMKIGAGVGSWLYGFQDFVQAFVAQPVDFIDMHVYPVNQGFLQNALTIASTAGSAGKPVAMTECWLNKVRDSELNVVPAGVIRGRNPFSFWTPLDTYFLQTMESLAKRTNMLFLAPTGSEYYWAYQPYNSTTMNWSPAQILSQEMQLVSQANSAAGYTSTGMSYYHSIVSPPDQIPPSIPSNVTGVSGTPTQASITWGASTDNVGVAGYNVFRNGEKVTVTSQTYFQDAGLSGSTTYHYVVEAFDLAGNASTPSPSVAITTR